MKIVKKSEIFFERPTRRTFLRGLLAASCSALAGPAVRIATLPRNRPPVAPQTPPEPALGANLTNEQKEQIIAQALKTDEGGTILAQAMVEPIRRSLEYQAVGRKLLLVDELPEM